MKLLKSYRCISPGSLWSGRQISEIAEDKLGKENRKEGKKKVIGLWKPLIICTFRTSIVREVSKNQLDAMFMCTNHAITVPIKKYTHDVSS